MKNLLTLILLSITGLVHAQQINGIVLDANTRDPLPFVNISIPATGMGTTTDVNGKFSFNTKGAADIVNFSFIGYIKRSIPVSEISSDAIIILNPSTLELSEVLIFAGENPAHRIIKRAIENRRSNDPSRLGSYSFKSYNKTVITLDGIDHENQEPDAALDKKMAGGHLAMSETVSEVKHMKPNLHQEVIIGNKFSGLDNPTFAFISSSFQPFAFYATQLALFDELYINPISEGSIKRYSFSLVDTLINTPDTTYIITYEPQRKIEHKTLKGLLYISTDGYAIENVIASPADSTMKLDFTIQQKYKRVDGVWFPAQLYTRYTTKDYKIAKHAMVVKNQSYLSEIEILPELKKKTFGLLNVKYENGSHLFDQWEAVRVDSLSAREAKTYYNYDTLSSSSGRLINGFYDKITGLAGGIFSVCSFDILPQYLLRLNRYEKIGLGFGLATNDQISRHFTLYGYGAYGFGDEALKYGGGLQLNLNRVNDHYISFNFNQDLQEPGAVAFYKTREVNINRGGDGLRRFLTERMDSVKHISASYNFRPLRYVQTNVFLNYEERNPTYQYRFSGNGDNIQDQFEITQVGFNVRFLLNENLMQMGNFKILTGNSFPYITLRVVRAWDNLYQSDFKFTKANIHIKQVLNSPALGRTGIDIFAGKIWGDDVPFSYLINGRSLRYDEGRLSFHAEGYFQVMGLYEFMSDQYFQGSLTQNFGPIFKGGSGKFRPELTLVQNIGYGSLRNTQDHFDIEFKTMEKGYFESGLMLDNIIRLESKLYWLGYGAGVFYKYGAYASSKEANNFVFTISSSISF